MPKLQALGHRCKDELLKMRSLKSKLVLSFETISTMRDYQVDAEGNPLDATKCTQILDSAKTEVKEVMSVIAVAKMVLADSIKKTPLAITNSVSSVGNVGFPAMGSDGRL